MFLRFTAFLFTILYLSNSLYAQDCGGLSLSSITNPGPYAIGIITESDGLRNGPDYYEGTLHYPLGVEEPMASIAIVPGFFSDEVDIIEWGPFLASHGIISFTIGTNFYSDFPTQRAYALLDALESIKQENGRLASPLFGLVDEERMAVGGWSMGGGGAQYAAVIDPSIKAIIALCPWLNSSSPADLNHPVPLLILSGENDGVAPVNSHANIHYTSTPATTNKLLFEIDNGDHSVANEPTGAGGDAGRIALAWLKTYLLDEPCYCPLLLDTPSSSSSYLTNIECSLTQNLSLNLKTFLQGPYNETDMDDYLRVADVIPLDDPYVLLGFNDLPYTPQSTTNLVLNETGDNAIVDWVFIELRNPANPSEVLANKAALIQRDGDIVGVDGESSVIFNDMLGVDVLVAVRHRNHLGMRTLNSFVGSEISIDFTDINVPLHGSQAMNLINGVHVMYAGNANFDGQINSIDKNSFWRLQNAGIFNYLSTNADFDLNGAINSVDKNSYWRVNNSKLEQLD